MSARRTTSARTASILQSPFEPMRTTKPSRFRSACNSCHRAKLRCSGERDRCFRCTKLDLTCQYTISMVGRASKRSRLKNAANLESSLPSLAAYETDNIELPDLAVSENSRQGDTGVLNEDLLNELDNNLPSNYTFDLSSEFPSIDELLEISKSGCKDHASTGSPLVDPHKPDSMHCSNDEIGPNAANSGPNFTAQTLYNNDGFPPALQDSAQFPPATMQRGLPLAFEQDIELSNNADTHLPHMHALSEIIANLDIYVQRATAGPEEEKTGTKAGLDRVLQLGKTSIDQILAIMHLSTYSSQCRSCKTLICAALDLLVRLYEESNLAKPSSAAETQTGEIPSLFLGIFEIPASIACEDSNAEEQRREQEQEQALLSSFRKHVICRELRRITPLLHALRKGCGARAGSECRKRHHGLFEEMENRVRAVIEKV